MKLFEFGKLHTVVCRPALPMDTPDVLELTGSIWEGQDYVPQVWQEWLADAQGLLAVAELAGRVVGLSKLTRLDPFEWWLEGLRVHPQQEGRGVASHLHDYLMDYWQRHGDGTIGLATASFRVQVRHLAERTGFDKVGEFTFFIARLDQAADEPKNADFRPLEQDEIPKALDFARGSESLEMSHGLMDRGIQWVNPTARYFAEAVNRGWAWWWRNRRGLLLAREDRDDEGNRLPMIQLLACPTDQITALLINYGVLAASLGYRRAGWAAPLEERLLPRLEGAGFRRDWDDSLLVYRREHPTRRAMV